MFPSERATRGRRVVPNPGRRRATRAAASTRSAATAKHELRTLERRWSLALRTGAFGIWDLDVAREEVHFSPQWKATLGYPAHSGPDSTALWRSRVHPDDLPGMIDTLFAHLEARTPSYETEYRMRAADGSYRWVMARGRVVQRDPQGQAVRVIGTLTDLTDRHEAQAMREARDRAEAAYLARNEFLARMSHDLRTPLNAILGCAQLLGGSLGDKTHEEWLARIEQAGWQLLAMVDEMMDLSSK